MMTSLMVRTPNGALGTVLIDAWASWSNPRADFNQGKVTFHLSVKLPPLNVPSSFSVRFPPGGLFVPAPEKVITVVAHCPGPRFPNSRGTGPPFVVGEKSVAAVSLTLFAVTEPLF